jgi:hypothetical protein
MPENQLTDEQLLAAVGEAVAEHDPVPPTVVTAARASLTWRTIDAELAELTEDSALHDLAGVRSTATPRLLTFETPSLEVVVEITETGERRRLAGQLAEPALATIKIRHQSGSTTEVQTDSLGRFAVDDIEPGLVSLVCRFADGSRTVVTAWLAV